MKITIRRLIFGAAFVTAGLVYGASAGHAGSYGDQKWCAVTEEGGDSLNWDCEYDSAADCQPAVTAANRGFCAINPYYRPEPAPAPQR